MLIAQQDPDSAENHAVLWLCLLIVNIGIPLGIIFYPELIAAYMIVAYNSVILIMLQYSLMVLLAFSLVLVWIRLLLVHDVRIRSNNGSSGIALASFVAIQTMIPLLLLAT